tara:strand:- start:106 stop:336 length:231 start_codon:yes stop_codon:yes gene_type:complete
MDNPKAVKVEELLVVMVNSVVDSEEVGLVVVVTVVGLEVVMAEVDWVEGMGVEKEVVMAEVDLVVETEGVELVVEN